MEAPPGDANRAAPAPPSAALRVTLSATLAFPFCGPKPSTARGPTRRAVLEAVAGRAIVGPMIHAALIALAVSAGAGGSGPACADSPAADAAVVHAVQAWFDALRRDDLKAGAALQAVDFHAFDGGRRYRGLELSERIRAVHASGVQLVWNLGPIEAHAACDMAWASWENKGEAGKPGAMEPVSWQESAVLRREHGRWVLAFLHSNRVDPPH